MAEQRTIESSVLNKTFEQKINWPICYWTMIIEQLFFTIEQEMNWTNNKFNKLLLNIWLLNQNDV